MIYSKLAKYAKKDAPSLKDTIDEYTKMVNTLKARIEKVTKVQDEVGKYKKLQQI